MSRISFTAGLALTLFVLQASCGQNAALTADGGLDASPPPCPSNILSTGNSCAFPGQSCQYPEGTAQSTSCNCVGPELIWQCCSTQYQCGADPAHPALVEGAPCCTFGAQNGFSIECTWCASDDVANGIACAVDGHWRSVTLACVYPYDGGTDAGPGPVDSSAD